MVKKREWLESAPRCVAWVLCGMAGVYGQRFSLINEPKDINIITWRDNAVSDQWIWHLSGAKDCYYGPGLQSPSREQAFHERAQRKLRRLEQIRLQTRRTGGDCAIVPSADWQGTLRRVLHQNEILWRGL